jgi:hypothetical protein
MRQFVVVSCAAVCLLATPVLATTVLATTVSSAKQGADIWDRPAAAANSSTIVVADNDKQHKCRVSKSKPKDKDDCEDDQGGNNQGGNNQGGNNQGGNNQGGPR